MTLQTLLNKRVLTADGEPIGHVYDFKAECDGPDILITHVCVGGAAWLTRIGLPDRVRCLFRASPEMDIPWDAIASADKVVRLKIGWNRARCHACEKS